MRYATIRTASGTSAARIDGDTATEIAGFADVGALLRAGNPPNAETGARHSLADVDLAAAVTTPSKVVCVGLNYRTHILEMGRELPQYPTLFTKFAESLIGAHDPIRIPPETSAVDWEGELAVIVGSTIRRGDREKAQHAIAGYTVMNDITMRDWQYRSVQWFQGKAWEASTPLGPIMVTPDELPAHATLTTRIGDEIVQSADIDDLVFDPADLVAYLSTLVTLHPGDVIATGTPGGVGHARKPPRYLTAGQSVTVSIDGIGSVTNACVAGVS